MSSRLIASWSCDSAGHPPALRITHEAAQPEAFARYRRERGDCCLATPAKAALERALSGDCCPRLRVVHRDHRRESLGVVAPYLDRERALAGRGEHLLEVEKLSGTFRPTEPRKPGGR